MIDSRARRDQTLMNFIHTFIVHPNSLTRKPMRNYGKSDLYHINQEVSHIQFPLRFCFEDDSYFERDTNGRISMGIHLGFCGHWKGKPLFRR